MRTEGAAPVTIRRLAEPTDRLAEMKREVSEGLGSTPKRLPSKYFYDARGSELFELITQLPEYYLTDAEIQILEAQASGIMAVMEPDELIELGSGSSRKNGC